MLVLWRRPRGRLSSMMHLSLSLKLWLRVAMHVLVLKMLHRRHLHETLRRSWALIVDRRLLVMLHV